MIQAIKQLLGMEPKADYAALIQQGAVFIDVRSKAEFNGGHLKGAINIPLDQLSSQLSKIKKNKPVITCCASGMRSASAKSLLQSNGFEVYNGGGWTTLNRYV
ncbi:MAG: rhodanese-like domain-containing protein [Cyclobacteriaceae bacterium]